MRAVGEPRGQEELFRQRGQHGQRRQQGGGDGQGGRAATRPAPPPGPQPGQRDVPDMIEQHAKADEKPEVTDAIGNECLDRGVARGFFLVPESD